MKKILTTILAAVMLVSNNGLQAGQQQSTQPAPQVLVENSDEHIDTTAVLKRITAGLKIKPDTTEKKKDEGMPLVQAAESSPTPEQEKAQKPSNGEEKASTSAALPAKVAATPAPKEPDTGYLVVKVKATPTPPAATSAPTVTPAPTPEPPAPTPEPPIPTPEPAQPTPEPIIEEPSFDISYWIGYAQSYAQGLGLRLEGSAVDCWDNPIGAGPHSTCLERDISSRLNRYANDPDITDVWIWYESTGGSNYNIYIGYA